MKTALYRHFAADETLLYVGISLAPIDRLSAHAGRSHWAQTIARVSIEWFESREAAIAAEGAAILSEHPLHNIAGTSLPPRRPAPPIRAPRAPRWVDSPEKVAAHFSVGIRAVQMMIREGMPREQVSARRFRFELGEVEAWIRARTMVADERRQAAREDAKAEALHVMREAMDKAFGR